MEVIIYLRVHLHSTIFILKPEILEKLANASKFTFYNIYIKTKEKRTKN